MTVLAALSKQLQSMELDLVLRFPDGTQERAHLYRRVMMGLGGRLYVIGARDTWLLEAPDGCAVEVVERGTGRSLMSLRAATEECDIAPSSRQW